ncbi:UNVERIFIED_CONTAM: hypothetical protein GTU68_007244 [Idotea baltica]|nr:hypothetical protein [Idotea baltica]
MTGASGAQYGIRLLEELVKAKAEVSLLLSRPAQIVINTETEFELFNAASDQIKVYEREQWMAPIASGSGVADATVVCPCTTGTLSAIAVGSSNNLIERAADVALKERKKLVLVIRETPFSDIHLENMLKLSRMGAVILPANPGFYHKPETLDDIINFMVARILEHLDIQQDILPMWGK